jgi:ATP-dependent Clp protease ATP-binding subunit ClpA
MIAQELEVSLHMAFVEAAQQRHEFITVEHLLLALLDNPSAAEVLRACAANIEDLRKSLSASSRRTRPTVGGDRRGRHPADARLPARDPARDHARAVHRQRQEGSDRRQRAGRDLRREGLARRLLPAPAGVTRLDVVNFIAHGIKKSDPPSRRRQRIGLQRGDKEEGAARQGLAAGSVHAPT